MNRRTLVSIIGIAPILAACSSLSSTLTTPAAVTSDIDLVINGLKSLLPYITSKTTGARYSGYLDQLASLAKAVATSQNANSTKSTVSQILAVVGDALKIVSGIALPGIGPTIISAVQVMLPFIAAGAGILGFAVAPQAMSPEQARGVLASVR